MVTLTLVFDVYYYQMSTIAQLSVACPVESFGRSVQRWVPHAVFFPRSRKLVPAGSLVSSLEYVAAPNLSSWLHP